jgi:hypothetical protein
MVRSYLDDQEIALLPQDSNAEHRRNMWSYSVALTPVDVADVVAALNHVAAALRQRFASHVGIATFYAWYDQQAGQLRCSLASLGPESLPFGGAYFGTEDAAGVVRLAATDTHAGHIPWSDLADVTEESEDPAESPFDPFPVWWSDVSGADGSVTANAEG